MYLGKVSIGNVHLHLLSARGMREDFHSGNSVGLQKQQGISSLYKLYRMIYLQEENGKKEELITKEPSHPEVYGNGSMLYKWRVHLGLNNALKIFPTKITDDGKVFSCHVVYHPERIRKSSTTVRVFGKELPSAVLLLF